MNLPFSEGNRMMYPFSFSGSLLKWVIRDINCHDLDLSNVLKNGGINKMSCTKMFVS